MIFANRTLAVIVIFFACYSLGFRTVKRNGRFPIRLANGEDASGGFFEVYERGSWMGVCSHFWNFRNSKVVCRELGFSKFLSEKISNHASHPYIPKTGFYFRNIVCEGNEKSLELCGLQDVSEYDYRRYCDAKSAASRVYIHCSPEKDLDITFPGLNVKEDPPLRLRSPHISETEMISSGVLEFKRKGLWYEVCSDGWSDENSAVSCGHLGYPGFKKDVALNINAAKKSHFLLTNVSCRGDEFSLWACGMSELKYAECYSRQPVILSCQPPDKHRVIEEMNGEVRLRGGYNLAERRVEVFDGGSWGTICDDGWDIRDANVVCRQLGFGLALEATHWADHGEGIGQITMVRVDCIGSEEDVRKCSHSKDVTTCTHAEDAGVRCREPVVQQNVRLTGGTPNEGFVEVRHHNMWYGVCGIGFTQREGAVVCRQLGQGFVEEAFRSYKYGLNNRLLMYNVKCKGNETSLFECHHSGWFTGRCRYYDMASVKCRLHAPDLVMDIDTFSQSIKVDIHPLWQLTCSYEEGCLARIVNTLYDDPHNREKKRVLLKFTSRIFNKGAVSFRPHIDKRDWKWHSCHQHYHSIERFADYDLIDSDGLEVADGHKASFCLEDFECETGYSKVYNCTDRGDQGISVNCADTYKNTIDCQWIDITEVKDGNYSLFVRVNPTKDVTESDWLNNQAVCEVSYFDTKVTVGRCSADACYRNTFGGNAFGACCHFPFSYKGQTYYECTDRDSPETGRPWCATTVNHDKDGKWGFCNERFAH